MSACQGLQRACTFDASGHSPPFQTGPFTAPRRGTSQSGVHLTSEGHVAERGHLTAAFLPLQPAQHHAVKAAISSAFQLTTAAPAERPGNVAQGLNSSEQEDHVQQPVHAAPEEQPGHGTAPCQDVEGGASPSPPLLPPMMTLGTSFTISTMVSSSPSVLPQPSGCPPHGVKSVCGKRTKMEDSFAVQPNFCTLPCTRSIDIPENKLPARLVQLEAAAAGFGAAGSPTSMFPSSNSPSEDSLGSAPLDSGEKDTLHFFGVYDGHGGCEAAHHCANRLHHHLSELLRLHQQVNAVALLPDLAGVVCNAGECRTDWAECSADGSSAPCTGSGSSASGRGSHESSQTEEAMSDRSSNGGLECLSPRRPVDSTSALLQDALRDAFLRTDAEFAADGSASIVGSTAVVALLGTRKLWVANCGDSRAVLCRTGKAVQLTDDHKPEREDEAARVEKAGGQVLYWNGHRVMGVLAMSRAIGDHGLRPYIIPEPEITVVTRSDEDDFLLLASDGLWDVMANQEATNLAVRCLARAGEKGASRKAAVRIAASVLTKAAIDRGSKDNVTVVIVDLKPATMCPPPPATEGAAAAAAVEGGSVGAGVTGDQEAVPLDA